MPECLPHDFDDDDDQYWQGGRTLVWDDVYQVVIVPAGLGIEVLGAYELCHGDFSAYYLQSVESLRKEMVGNEVDD